MDLDSLIESSVIMIVFSLIRHFALREIGFGSEKFKLRRKNDYYFDAILIGIVTVIVPNTDITNS